MDKGRHRFEIIIFHITPRLIADRGVCLPVILADVIEFAALDVVKCGAFGECLVLVLDDDFLAPFSGAVVVIGSKLLQPGRKDSLLDPPVEPEDLWLIFIDKFAAACQPIVKEFAIRQRAPFLA